MSKTYFVSPSGNDNNPGTKSQPFKTIQKAANIVNPGDIVEVRGGTYNESVNISRGGTQGQSVTFRNYNGETVWIDGNHKIPFGPVALTVPKAAPINAGTTRTNTPLVHIKDCSYVVWDGIGVKRSYGRGIQAARLDAPCTNITIKNSTIDSNYGQSVSLWYVEEARVENCTINNGGCFAPYARSAGTPEFVNWPGSISCAGAKSVTVTGCTISNNWGECILFDSNEHGSDGLQMDNNVIFDNFASVSFHAGKNVVFERNYIYRSEEDKKAKFRRTPTTGIVVVPTEKADMPDITTANIVIRNNIIVEPWHGITIRKGGATSRRIENVRIYNNTVVNSHPNGPGLIGFYSLSYSDIEFKNNIFYNSNGAPTDTSLGRAGDVNFSNNYWNKKPSSEYVGKNDVVNAQSPFVDIGHEPHAGKGDPTKYRIVDGSGAQDAGIVLQGFNDDFGGATRVGTWDIGPWEINGREPSPPEQDTITADFTADKSSGTLPLQVAFTDKSTSNKTITGWLWDFGDGSTSTAQNPTHVYATAGTFTVSLRVTGEAGQDTVTRPGAISVIAAAPPSEPTVGRVAGTAVLYRFTTGTGTIIKDVSGNGEPLNLVVQDPQKVKWLNGGGLEVTDATLISSKVAAAKLISACKDSHELTIEAWIKTADVNQDGPARIITISRSEQLRNFTLAEGLWGSQPKDVFDVRLRTSQRSNNGTPSFSTNPGAVTADLMHVVFVRERGETARIYVNGKEVAKTSIPGNLANWNNSYPFTLANELNLGRPWLGQYFLVAAYSRALSAAEVSQNYNAGYTTSEGDINAQFAVAPGAETGTAPYKVQFDASASEAANGIAAYAWDFGDGQTSTEKNPEHVFTAVGQYDVSLTITDSTGKQQTETKPAYITVVGKRVTRDLLALYTFWDGSGDTIHDVSGAGWALNLTIDTPKSVEWLKPGLRVNSSARISSGDPASKIHTAVQRTNAITLEAWIKPAKKNQSGPARVVSISKNTTERNLTLAHGLWNNKPQDVVDVRLRTTGTDTNGVPSLTSPTGSITTDKVHVVYTRTADGQTQLYLDGKPVASGKTDGDFSNWDSGLPLLLANEATGDRPWVGDFYTVAFYSRALTADEVTQNYAAGQPAQESAKFAPSAPRVPEAFKRFVLVRPGYDAEADNNDDQIAYGAQYPDGRCVLVWQGSTAFAEHATMDDATAEHVDAQLEWLD